MPSNCKRAMREKQINIRLSADESEQYDAVASHYGIAGTWIFRMWLKTEHEKLSQKQRQNKPKKGFK